MNGAWSRFFEFNHETFSGRLVLAIARICAQVYARRRSIVGRRLPSILDGGWATLVNAYYERSHRYRDSIVNHVGTMSDRGRRSPRPCDGPLGWRFVPDGADSQLRTHRCGAANTRGQASLRASRETDHSNDDARVPSMYDPGQSLSRG